MPRPCTMWLSCMRSMMKWWLHSTGSAHRICFHLPLPLPFLPFVPLLPVPFLPSFPAFPLARSLPLPLLPFAPPFPLPSSLASSLAFAYASLRFPCLPFPFLICFSYLTSSLAFHSPPALDCFALHCFAPDHIMPAPLLACICSMHL